jgi:VanZ family protein
LTDSCSKPVVPSIRWKYFLPSVIWAVIILVLLIIPDKDIPELSLFSFIPFFDKWVHGALFAILTFLVIFSFRKQSHSCRVYSYSIAFSILTGFVYGGFTELIQMLAGGGRHAEIFDWLADLAGSIAGIVIYLSACRIFVKRKAN